MPLDLAATLAELVAIPSVNPMGRQVSGEEFLEHRVTDYLERLFRRLNLPCMRQPLEPRRENILARLDGGVAPEQGGPLLLFEAHQDTVPTDGMTIEPWNPVIRDGRLYGRGSCDIKGGMTAMLGAVARLAAEPPARRPTIVMACTVNEEHGFTGAARLTRLWSGETPSLFARRPDAAVIAEPTRLAIVVAHKGTVRWRCHTRGRAAHSSQPQLGENAVFKMAPVLAAWERYQREIVPALGEHPLCGRPSLSVGLISGGLSVNTVPDRCTIEIDRRILPGEDPQAAWRQAVDYLSSACGPLSAEHEAPYLQSGGLSDEANGELAGKLGEAVRATVGRCERIGVSFGTNASAIATAGVPTVVFGPGSIDQAHTADEWIALEQVSQAEEALVQFARSLA